MCSLMSEAVFDLLSRGVHDRCAVIILYAVLSHCGSGWSGDTTLSENGSCKYSILYLLSARAAIFVQFCINIILYCTIP